MIKQDKRFILVFDYLHRVRIARAPPVSARSMVPKRSLTASQDSESATPFSKVLHVKLLAFFFYVDVKDVSTLNGPEEIPLAFLVER
jgi:hypothetical protein